MNYIKVNEKTGFYCFDSIIKIYDHRGVLFYFKENKNGKIRFNLPKGLFQTNCDLYKLKEPVKYRFTNLPKGNNIKKLPKNFKIVYINNPHKCSVDNDKHIIYFDNSFKQFPLPVKDYIKFHELGHYFYSGENNKSEILCDLFAKNCMLKVGYNPSQIQWAQNGTLSDSDTSSERKKIVKEKIKKTFYEK